MNNKLTVFLGGTCGDSTWREELSKLLTKQVVSFNPVVKDWTFKNQEIEDEHKDKDDIVLFVITPESSNIYSASEVAQTARLFPSRTILCVLFEANGKKFNSHEQKTWKKILEDINNFGAVTFLSLKELAKYLNNLAKYWKK